MTKRILSIVVLLSVVFLLFGCTRDLKGDATESAFESSQDESAIEGDATESAFESPQDESTIEGDAMKFTFESLQDKSLVVGSVYFMDFGEMESQEDAAIAEGKLLSAFGQPEYTSENYENSFNYIIRATADNGESVILTVYGMGVVHIGAEQQNDFAQKAASALIEYVNAFEPSDYSRTVYYLDFALQIDIQVKNGEVTIEQSQMSEEKISEIISKLYKWH